MTVTARRGSGAARPAARPRPPSPARAPPARRRGSCAAPRRGARARTPARAVAPGPLTSPSAASSSSTEVSRPWPMLIGPVSVAVGGQQVRAHDVGDLDPVARLAAVAEHRRPVPVDQVPAEDRHDARLAVDVLAGSVDVAVAQRHGREPVQAGVQLAVALGGVLALAVRGQRTGSGSPRASAAPRRRRTARRRWSVLTTRAGAGRARRLEHRDRPEHVDVGVVGGMLDRVAHVDLGREVEHELGPDARERSRPPPRASRTSSHAQRRAARRARSPGSPACRSRGRRSP